MNFTLATGFKAFTLLHGLTAVCCVAGIIALVLIGLKARKRGRDRSLTVVIALVGLLFWLIQQGYYVIFEQIWADSLPLHICDMAGLVGPLALLIRKRVLRTTLYFWALGLTIWGLVTPTLTHGPEHIRFWLFWLSHSAVLFYATYDCVVNRYRPFLADWGMACLVTMAYLALLLPLNLANPGWNYGYIGNVTLNAATPLDLLPEWPWRILGIEVLGGAILALAWLPWEVARWRSRRRLEPKRIAGHEH